MFLPNTFQFVHCRHLSNPIAHCEHLLCMQTTSQITLAGHTKYHAKQVARTKESINRFEHKWIIQTNQSKFQLIPIEQRKAIGIVTLYHTIKHCYERKALRFTITSTGFIKHVDNRVLLSKLQLTKPQRSRNLRIKNK